MQPSDVKYVMVARARLALYESSAHELDATDDELRAAIAAALTAMPDDLLRKLVAERGCVLVPREPTEAVIQAIEKEWFGSQIDMAKREYRAMLAVFDFRQQADKEKS